MACNREAHISMAYAVCGKAYAVCFIPYAQHTRQTTTLVREHARARERARESVSESESDLGN